MRKARKTTGQREQMQGTLKYNDQKEHQTIIETWQEIWRRSGDAFEKMHPEVMPKPIGIDIWVFNVNDLELRLLTVWGLLGGYWWFRGQLLFVAAFVCVFVRDCAGDGAISAWYLVFGSCMCFGVLLPWKRLSGHGWNPAMIQESILQLL